MDTEINLTNISTCNMLKYFNEVQDHWRYLFIFIWQRKREIIFIKHSASEKYPDMAVAINIIIPVHQTTNKNLQWQPVLQAVKYCTCGILSS